MNALVLLNVLYTQARDVCIVEGNIASHSGDGIVPTRLGRVGAVESVETEFEPDGKHDRFPTCPRLNWEESVVCFVRIVAKQMALYAQQGHTRII